MLPKKITFNNDYLIYPDGRVWSTKTNTFLIGDTNNIGYKRVVIDKHAFALGLRKINYNPEKVYKTVGKYNKKNELICTYKNATEAAKDVQGTAKMIRRVCQGHRKYAYGFNWKYISEEKPND